MNREIPFYPDKYCSNCGRKGAYDFMGDYLCELCIDTNISEDNNSYSDYRVLVFEEEDNVYFEIHEVYYKDGKPTSYAEEDFAPIGSSLDELNDILDSMKLALEKPILYGGIKFPEKYQDSYLSNGNHLSEKNNSSGESFGGLYELLLKRIKSHLREVEVKERIYDYNFDKDGKEKPNKSFGKFLMTREWEDKMYENYNFETFGYRDEHLYLIVGREVSGYKHPDKGGIVITVTEII